MNVKTYQGASIAEALAKVKQELGSGAVILHTRSFKRGGIMGFGARNVVEITAGLEKERKGIGSRVQGIGSKARTMVGASAISQSPPTASARAEGRHPLKSAYGLGDSSAGGVAVLTKSETRGGVDVALSTKAFAGSVLKEPAFELRNEIAGLRTMEESLLQRTAHQGKRADLPETLNGLYTQLLQQQISDEIAYRVVDDVRAELAPDQMGNANLIKEKLTQKLEQMLPANLNHAVARPTTGAGCRSICLIGPTGVGKTTTIAKLAAAFKLRQKQKVGLITIDTYRIAAVDQLRTYANIIGVPLKVVLTPTELVAAMKEFADYDTVLIDTAGRSHTDQLKLAELAQFIAVAKPSEVHLVLSSTTTQEAMEAALERFGTVRVDQIIFTKLDEAVSFGVLLNVARTASRALSYITTGQDVPDNIEVGQPRRLAKLILGDRL